MESESPSMAQAWSRKSRIEMWLQSEAAVVAARATGGQISSSVASAIVVAITQIDVDALAAAYAQEDEVAEWIGAFTARLEAEQISPMKALPIISIARGLTLALTVRDAGILVLDAIYEGMATLVAAAERHRATPEPHTHTHDALTDDIEPCGITVGVRLAGWVFELNRGRRRLARSLEEADSISLIDVADHDFYETASKTLRMHLIPFAADGRSCDRFAELQCALAIATASAESCTRYVQELTELLGSANHPSSRGADVTTPTSTAACGANLGLRSTAGNGAGLDAWLVSLERSFEAAHSTVRAVCELAKSGLVDGPKPDALRTDISPSSEEEALINPVFDRLHSLTRHEQSLYG